MGEEEHCNNNITFTRYLIVRPEYAGIFDMFRFALSPSPRAKFIETSLDDQHLVNIVPDHRWVILVSILVRKLIAFFRKPMEWAGYFVDFFLNLLSLNGNTLIALLSNFLHCKVIMPRRGSETFISSIGHLDPRIELDKNDLFLHQIGKLPTGADFVEIQSPGLQLVEIQNRALMDLSMMSSKLAYENANVVRNVVNQHWKMHFVDFYDCWNDYQKERSTQAFILCDKPKDANLILISFRGTEPFDADDWCTDFDYSWYEIPKLGKVHMGFLEALGLGSRADPSTFCQVLQVNNTSSDEYCEASGTDNSKKITAYFGLRSKLKRLLKEHKNAKFIVTGHSLGGALAILFPTVLVVHEEEEIMQRMLGVHTFGQPRIGNMQLGKYMENHLIRPIPKYYRVVYCTDLVPRLPYDDKTFLYKHFGVCLYYNSLYIEQKVDEEPNRNYFGMLYVIPDIINSGWELIRSLMAGYIYGPEYKEGWLSIMLRVVGLVFPGLSAHSPTNYVNSIRLGRMRNLQPSSL